MSLSNNYLQAYNELPSAARRRVMATLKYWGGWTKTSVYRKLDCPNLSPIEKVLIDGVMSRALHSATDGGKQLEIRFEWSTDEGFLLR